MLVYYRSDNVQTALQHVAQVCAATCFNRIQGLTRYIQVLFLTGADNFDFVKDVTEQIRLKY
jgi:hypothetical protein